MRKFILNPKTYSEAVKKKSFANVLKTKKKKKSPDKKKVSKTKKVNPFLLSKSIIKFKQGLSKNKKKNVDPLIFIIQGHSSSCFFKDMDLNINSGTLKPIHILEKAVKKYPFKRAQIIDDIEKLRNHDMDNIFCHKYYKKCKKKAIYFSPECLTKTKGKKYFWCEDCNYFYHQELDNELYRPIKFNNRIDLEKEFKDDKIKILMAQSPGRAGLVKTGFVMLEESNKFKKPILDLFKTKTTEIKKTKEQIKNLNILTNRINPKFKKIHKNKMDTDFRIYPRINEEKFKEKGKNKIKKRKIPGPIDVSINFNINTKEEQINGIHWPLGVFCYQDIDDDTYELLFNDNDKNNKFFNKIESYEGNNKGTIIRNFKRGLLLGIHKIPLKLKKNKNVNEDHEMLQFFLNLQKDGLHFSTKPLDKMKIMNSYKHFKSSYINKYNQYLYENLFFKDGILKTKVSLREIIINILNYLDSLRNYKDEKRDVIFVINQCRGIQLDKNNIPLGNNLDQTQDPRTINYFTSRREDSNNA